MADKMDKAIELLQQSIIGIRLGTVTPALIDTFKVTYYGQQMPIKHLAYTSAERGNVMVKPHDPSILGTIQKTLKEAGFNAYTFSKEAVAVSVPPICGEEKEKVKARVRKLGEETKITIRSIRKNWRSTLDKNLPDDERRSQESSIQESTDAAIQMVDEIVDAKIVNL